MSTGCVILAAGASQRLGHPKQLARLAGETLLDRAVRVAKEAGCSPIVVVLGAEAEAIIAGCLLDGTEVIINSAWAKGMGGSIRAGVDALLDQVTGTIVITCDQPAVDSAHLRRLIDLCLETQADQPKPVASRYAERNGVPACFPATMFPQLMRLEGDQGARQLLANARWVELPEGDLDVDTPASLEQARRVFGRQG